MPETPVKGQPTLNTTPLKRRRSTVRRAFSIIELLVAIIIIGVLVAILIPVVSNRSEQARIARANSDLEGLSASMERVAVDTGYYVRLFAMNDTLQGDAVGFSPGRPGDPQNDYRDAIQDYRSGVSQPYIQFPGATNGVFINPATGDYVTGGVLFRDNFINSLVAAETAYDGSLAWNGPYINWQKDSNLVDVGVNYKDGIPDDPWGNNYLFFTKAGLILEPTGFIVNTSVSVSTVGDYSIGGPYETNVFDRPTMISTGPNGLPGDGSGGIGEGDFGRADDLKRQFGQ